MNKQNYIIGILGRKGSGKSYLAKKSIEKIDRLLIIDVLNEYHNGLVFCQSEDILEFLQKNADADQFRIIYKVKDDADLECLFHYSTYINNYTILLEEADLYASPVSINSDLLQNIKYGRHKRRNLIYISRRPYEINRNLTAQSDLIISFEQKEKRDLEYLKFYGFDAEALQKLNEHAFLTIGDDELLFLFS